MAYFGIFWGEFGESLGIFWAYFAIFGALRIFSAALNISRHPSVGGEGAIQQGGSCLATHVPPAASHTAALGGSVAVLDGLGAGDYRRVAAWEGNTITLDRPFATELDGSSFINVCTAFIAVSVGLRAVPAPPASPLFAPHLHPPFL